MIDMGGGTLSNELLDMFNYSADTDTSSPFIQQRKYKYKVSFFIATHMCRKFYYGKTTSPNLEAIIAPNIIPIWPDHYRKRNMITKIFIGFLYRVV